MKQIVKVCIVVLILASSVQAQGKDMLWKRGSAKMIAGEISQVSPESISIKANGKSQQIPVGEVERLMFADDPSGLASVRSSFKNGQLKQAKTQLESVKAEGRPFVKQDIDFYKAAIVAKLALRGESDVKDAAREVGGFLKNNANSFRFYEANEVMGDLAMSLGRFDSATKYYAKLTKSSSSSLAVRGSLLLGDAWLLQGDLQQAGKMFARCSDAKDLRLRALGELGIAASQCGTLQGAEQAIPKIEKVIAENDSSDVELFARAYNTLGQAYLVAGKKESALDAYLHTDLLFYRDSEKHAEALFHLSKLWSEVNKPGEANKARDTLKRRYASSVWAKR